MQNIRIVLITLLLTLLFCCAFVLGKLLLVYFICWAIFFMLLALVMLSCASGRQVVEKKMRDKLKETETNQGKTVKRVELPALEKTIYWKTALRLYSIALPFYCMCLVLFYYKPLGKDIACQLCYLKCSAGAKDFSDPNEAAAFRTACKETRDDCPLPGESLTDIKEGAAWRWPLFVLSMWMPLVVVLFELAANRIEMRIGHLSYQVIMWASYVFVTLIGEVLAGYPIFPNSFNWKCGNNECWSQLIGTMLYMLALQVVFFFFFYFVHLFRNKKLKEYNIMPGEPTTRESPSRISTQIDPLLN